MKSKILISASDIVSVTEESSYNRNYYRLKNSNVSATILEVCHEDDNFYEYLIVDGNKEIFIGCSENSLDEGVAVEIDFLYYYT